MAAGDEFHGFWAKKSGFLVFWAWRLDSVRVGGGREGPFGAEEGGGEGGERQRDGGGGGGVHEGGWRGGKKVVATWWFCQEGGFRGEGLRLSIGSSCRRCGVGDLESGSKMFVCEGLQTASASNSQICSYN